MADAYIERIVDAQIERSLRSTGAVLIEGAKWCGKTRTAKERASSVLLMQNPSSIKVNLNLAETDPSKLLGGDIPRLIDEWQLAPSIWDAVRYEVDERGKPGQFILTGSSLPPESSVRHSGAGRIFRITMRPMSLYESKESNGSVSFRELFDGAIDVRGNSDMTLDELSFLIIRGGWPSSVLASKEYGIDNVQMYIENIIQSELSIVDGIRRNPIIVRELLRSLSRNMSSMATLTTIRADMTGQIESISDKTVNSYINALRQSFVIEDLAAWNPSLRSKTTIRGTPKRYFVDPSIATAVMRTAPEDLISDFNTFGLFFEALCIRDLRVYAQAIDGDVFHYRDRNDLEADAIIHLRNGKWGAIEIKVGNERVDLAARNLLKLKEKVDCDKMNAPSFLLVITSSGYAYRREDGVFVVPIGCLKH